MSPELRQHIEEYCKSKGDDTTDESIIEVVTFARPVWEGPADNHRWYSLAVTVVEINGRFVEYQACSPDGDNSIEDCNGGYKLEDFREVFPKQVITTIYTQNKD